MYWKSIKHKVTFLVFQNNKYTLWSIRRFLYTVISNFLVHAPIAEKCVSRDNWKHRCVYIVYTLIDLTDLFYYSDIVYSIHIHWFYSTEHMRYNIQQLTSMWLYSCRGAHSLAGTSCHTCAKKCDNTVCLRGTISTIQHGGHSEPINCLINGWDKECTHAPGNPFSFRHNAPRTQR